MGAAELGYRVVAVAEEDPLVELRRAISLLAVPADGDRRKVGRELLEEHPPQRAGVARIPGEQSPLDRLRQVDEGEDGPVEVGEMGAQTITIALAESLDGILHGRRIVAPASA